MKFLYFVLVSYGLCSTAPQRLRELFNSVKEFANESGTAPSEDTTNSIIETALRFANDNDRQLDILVHVLTTVCDNNIGKCDLDKIAWEAVARLYQQGTAKGQSGLDDSADRKPSQIETRTEIVGSVSAPPVVIPTPTIDSSDYENPSQKRSISDEPERRQRSRTDMKEELISILRHLRNIQDDRRPTNPIGTDYLNFIHYRMAVNGEYDKLMYQLEILDGLDRKHASRVFFLFQDAFYKLKDPSFSLHRNTAASLESRVDRILEQVNRTPAPETVISKLAEIVKEGRKFYDPSPATKEMQNKIYEMAKRNDFKSISYLLYVHQCAGTSYARKRFLVEKAYNYLKDSTERKNINNIK